LVTVENPTPRTTSMSVTPLKPLFLHLDSLGNVIDEEVPQLPERDFTETYMGSTEPTFGDEYKTLFHPTTAIDTNPTPSHSIWRTSSGSDLYENFESFRQPFNPHDPLVESGPSGQMMNHPIDHVINPIVASTKVYPNDGIITSTHSQGTSIPTPSFTNFHSTAPHDTILLGHLPKNAYPCQPNTTNWRETTTLSLLEYHHHGGPTPLQPPFHILTRGQPPFASYISVINPPLAGGQPFLAGNPSQSWGVSFGGTFTQPHIGVHSYHNPQGGVSNLIPSRPSYGQPYLGGIPNTTWSPQGQQTYPPHWSNVYLPPRSNPCPPQRKNFHPLSGQENQPAYNAQNPPGYANVS
jgi:hypothetical protein